MDCKIGSSFRLSMHFIASFPSWEGSWRHIQSTNDSKSFAKSRRYQSSNFGIAITFLMVEMPIAACKYSLLALSSSFSTCNAVYTRILNRKPNNIAQNHCWNYQSLINCMNKSSTYSRGGPASTGESKRYQRLRQFQAKHASCHHLITFCIFRERLEWATQTGLSEGRS